MQELLRHASVKVTADVYMQAVTLRSGGSKQAGEDGHEDRFASA